MPNRKRLFVTILMVTLTTLIFSGATFSKGAIPTEGGLWATGNEGPGWTEIFYENGYVGVGTNDPDRPLTVQADGDGSQWVSLMDTSGQTKWHINSHLGGINFAQTGIEDGAFFIGANGRVGIGTTQPERELHFKTGNQGGDGEPFLLDSGHVVGARMRFDAAAAQGRIWDIGSTAHGATDEGGGGKFMIRDGSVDQTRVIIDTKGDMGIGVMSPRAKLHVGGPLLLDEPTTGNQVPCDNEHRGALIYENDQFCGCKSNGWVRLDSSGEMCALVIKREAGDSEKPVEKPNERKVIPTAVP